MKLQKVKNLFHKLSLYNLVKGVRYLRHFGLREFLIRLSDRMEPEEVPYGPWYEAHKATEAELEHQRGIGFSYRPLISIAVPLFHTPEDFLMELLESVRAQTYSHWELCLADGSRQEGKKDPNEEKRYALCKKYAEMDSRIRLKVLPSNLGIAGNTNAAISMARGDYIGLLDHDDLLAPDALFEIVSRLQNAQKPELLYTDEDKFSETGGEHFQPNLKPDFNPDLLNSNNYICHFLVFSRALYRRIGGFSREYDGAQDYDFILRCTENAQGICHIPKVLYHWRTHAASTADNPLSKQYAYEAGRRAISDHLERIHMPGTVSCKKDFGFYRVTYPVIGKPLVSILIPNKDEKETLEKCLTSILSKTSYDNYEILILENNSKTPEIFEYYREIDRKGPIRVIYWDREFNYAAINNFGMRHAHGEYLLLLNNDIEVIHPDWLSEMLGHCMRPGTGVVGARLYYPDDTIQHAGIIIGIGGIAGSLFVGMKRSHSGYMHREALQQDLSAVTAACMMVPREVYRRVGGMTEALAVAFNDVDFCLKVREAGYLVVYDPYAELYHYESKTRGAEDSKEKVRRFQKEIEYMRTHWIRILKEGDPYYNPGFSLGKWDYSLRSQDTGK